MNNIWNHENTTTSNTTQGVPHFLLGSSYLSKLLRWPYDQTIELFIFENVQCYHNPHTQESHPFFGTSLTTLFLPFFYEGGVSKNRNILNFFGL